MSTSTANVHYNLTGGLASPSTVAGVNIFTLERVSGTINYILNSITVYSTSDTANLNPVVPAVRTMTSVACTESTYVYDAISKFSDVFLAASVNLTPDKLTADGTGGLIVSNGKS